jgi:pimeloyl-ACP methyl ester carboxylesterase
MAWIDAGPRDGHVVLCLHGEPSWSFLYRKMIPVFLEAGHRVVAPDLLGFGRSDEPVEDATGSFDFHRGSLTALLAHLGLDAVTLVCQDRGGLLGLTLPVDHPGLVARLLVMNTGLGVGRDPGPGRRSWPSACRTRSSGRRPCAPSARPSAGARRPRRSPRPATSCRSTAPRWPARRTPPGATSADGPLPALGPRRPS